MSTRTETETLLAKITANPALVSLLYDLDLLTEETMGSPSFGKTMLVALNWPDESAPARENAQLREQKTIADALCDQGSERIEELRRERDSLREELKRAGEYIEDNRQMRVACEGASVTVEAAEYQIAQLRAANRELAESAGAIVDFCDDPNGSEQPESLACGLARLLPKLRAALASAAKAGGPSNG